jgi:hypothetical protein
MCWVVGVEALSYQLSSVEGVVVCHCRLMPAWLALVCGVV